MRNENLLIPPNTLNAFTHEVKRRCCNQGSCHVKLRNGYYCDVVYRPANEEDGEMECFQEINGNGYWNLDGESVTASRFDMIEIND